MTETQKAFRMLWITNVVLICMVLGIVFVGWHDSRHHATDNQQRIQDIQQSRVLSCRATYLAFPKVFHPFFPPPGKQTKQQQHQLDLLDRTIVRLAAHCADQTSP